MNRVKLFLFHRVLDVFFFFTWRFIRTSDALLKTCERRNSTGESSRVLQYLLRMLLPVTSWLMLVTDRLNKRHTAMVQVMRRDHRVVWRA